MGIIVEDIQVGDGKKAVRGRPVEVHYRGFLQKGGKMFDTSRRSRNSKPFRFTLGERFVF